MYYICYELAKRGWNVMPTSRNAKGIDILIYSQNAKIRYGIQVKSLSKKVPVPLGNNIETSTLFLADYLMICTNISTNSPELFITRPEVIRESIHKGEKDGRISYWLDPKTYDQFRNNWMKLGVDLMSKGKWNKNKDTVEMVKTVGKTPDCGIICVPSWWIGKKAYVKLV
jgi:putative transposon-encoded protein